MKALGETPAPVDNPLDVVGNMADALILGLAMLGIMELMASKGATADQPACNLGYPYLVVWVVAAAAANTRTPVFYPALAALVGWPLWSARPRRYPAALWLALRVVSAGAGYGDHHGLARLQAWIEEVVPEWLVASGSRTDPYRSRTDLGHIGESSSGMSFSTLPTRSAPTSAALV